MSLLAAGARAPRRILAAEPCAFRNQKRMASRMKMAPSQRWKDRAKTPVVLTREERASRDKETRELNGRINSIWAQRDRERLMMGDTKTEEKAYMCRTTIQAAEAMTHEQAHFLFNWREGYEHNNETRESSFRISIALVKDITLDDVYDLNFILRRKGGVGCAKAGRELVRLCAENGHAEATIQVVASALRQDVFKPGIIRSRTAVMALDRLREVAKTGNVRAIVMEANVARHNGYIGKAITLYERALDLLVESDGVQPGDKYTRIKDELSSPWIELAYLHVSQGHHVDAVKAYLAGQEKDDPMAYFNLARLDFHMAGNRHSDDWLYTMTKAAASGHYKAAHELGEYYANSAANFPQPQESFIDKLKGFGSFLYKANVNLNPRVNIQYHDAFANTPVKRIKLAHQWLTIANNNYYLPANITLAELHLQRFIYPEGTLSRPLDPYGLSKGPGAIENPLFSPNRAQVMLTEVLTACLKIAEAQSVSTTNAEYLFLARPWSLHEEVFEVVESKELLQDLKEQAEMIADAAGIDIASTERLPKHIAHLGFLRYHKGTRGQGLWEIKEDSE